MLGAGVIEGGQAIELGGPAEVRVDLDVAARLCGRPSARSRRPQR